MTVQRSPFGTLPDGTSVDRIRLETGNGHALDLTPWGATIIGYEMPDRRGEVSRISLGYRDLAGYRRKHAFQGATVGRYANRIAGARFNLDGRTYRLDANRGEHHLHGGSGSYAFRLWRTEVSAGAGSARVVFRLTDPDGTAGYPGTLEVSASYQLSEDGTLTMGYEAATDAPTVVNLTNHTYWNLAGLNADYPRQRVHDHHLQVHASRIVVPDPEGIPTGIADLTGSPLDLRDGIRLGERMNRKEQIFDHCYLVDGYREGSEPRPHARLWHPGSGRVMEVSSTQPGLQVYTFGRSDGDLGPGQQRFQAETAVCLETQAPPDSPNRPEFPTTVLRPGQVYRHQTIHRFSVATD